MNRAINHEGFASDFQQRAGSVSAARHHRRQLLQWLINVIPWWDQLVSAPIGALQL